MLDRIPDDIAMDIVTAALLLDLFVGTFKFAYYAVLATA